MTNITAKDQGLDMDEDLDAVPAGVLAGDAVWSAAAAEACTAPVRA